MKNETKQNNATILALICSAAALMAAVFFVSPSRAPAEEAVKDRDYQIVTAAVASGSEGLYILDNRTGQVAVYLYEPGKPTLQLKGMQPIANAFGANR